VGAGTTYRQEKEMEDETITMNDLRRALADLDAPAYINTGTILNARDKRYTLTLSHKEAETLAVILANIGGEPDVSARKYAQSLGSKLTDMGFNWVALVDDGAYSHTGSFVFHGA
jgi:hypothetical protein